MTLLILSVLTIAFLMVCFYIVGTSENENITALFTTLGVTAFCCINLYVTEHSYKQGQIDAINNEYQYKQKVKYDNVDTGFVPIDTVYIKK